MSLGKCGARVRNILGLNLQQQLTTPLVFCYGSFNDPPRFRICDYRQNTFVRQVCKLQQLANTWVIDSPSTTEKTILNRK